MALDSLTGLPTVLVTGAVGAAVSALLSLFAPLLAQVPGFRSNDASRNALMRSLVFVLTLAGLVALAASQGITLPASMWPALILYAAGGAGFAHLVYSGAKASGSAGASVTLLPGTLAPLVAAPAEVAPLPVPAGGYPSDAAVSAK